VRRNAVGRHPVWTLLVVIVLIFTVVTPLAIFSGQVHHSGHPSAH
jgi:hypothetical protein